ncbi:DUF2759 domain-containing protein [Oceanobacillus salinisoli]|uniref:DUF2759 domain-containing protein n=1 Tax=Oceanobacillus salinisoli TaxID=2678611 RepID=UPI0038B3398F
MYFPNQKITTREKGHKEVFKKMHIVLGILFLFVALLAVVSVIRQLKFKNMFALIFSALTALVFGFFSIATIISEITG